MTLSPQSEQNTMKKTLLFLASLATLGAVAAESNMLDILSPESSILDLLAPAPLPQKAKGQRIAGELTVTGKYLQGGLKDGALLATGSVTATAAPYRFFSERVSRSVDGIYSFGNPAV